MRGEIYGSGHANLRGFRPDWDVLVGFGMEEVSAVVASGSHLLIGLDGTWEKLFAELSIRYVGIIA